MKKPLGYKKKKKKRDSELGFKEIYLYFLRYIRGYNGKQPIALQLARPNKQLKLVKDQNSDEL